MTAADAALGDLCRAVRELSHGALDSAQAHLRAVANRAQEQGYGASSLLAAIFASALLTRSGGRAPARANLYLTQFTLPQIELFTLLATRVPTIALSSPVANALLLGEIARAGGAPVTLLELGIGTGRQLRALLAEIARNGVIPPRLTIIAVEPDRASLDCAERALREAARALGTEFGFVGFCRCVEHLGADEWAAIASLRAGGRLLMNEAFALHHLPNARARDAKQATLRRLRQLAPELFVLTEPHVDHDVADLERRMLHCWRHFDLAFRMLDASDLTLEQAMALKTAFFAREIDDVLAQREELRSERHETADMWLERLVRAGFRPCRAALGSPIPESSVATVRDHGCYWGIDFGAKTQVAVICARS
ncbi:MAG TPA: GRAS family protein [Polyangiaceae bacterium]|jgi:SAM-dependent methyltransferase